MATTNLVSAGQAALAPDLSVLADKINEAHRRCEEAMTTGLQHALEVGQLLVKAKNQCEHGDWKPWVRENCKFSLRTAQAYMRVERKFRYCLAGKAQRVALLSLREALGTVAAVKLPEKPTATVLAAQREPPIREPDRTTSISSLPRADEVPADEVLNAVATIAVTEADDDRLGDEVLHQPVEPAVPPEQRAKSKAIFYGNEAVDALKRIPKNDPLLKRGFQIVTDWIKTRLREVNADGN